MQELLYLPSRGTKWSESGVPTVILGDFKKPCGVRQPNSALESLCSFRWLSGVVRDDTNVKFPVYAQKAESRRLSALLGTACSARGRAEGGDSTCLLSSQNISLGLRGGALINPAVWVPPARPPSCELGHRSRMGPKAREDVEHGQAGGPLDGTATVAHRVLAFIPASHRPVRPSVPICCESVPCCRLRREERQGQRDRAPLVCPQLCGADLRDLGWVSRPAWAPFPLRSVGTRSGHAVPSPPALLVCGFLPSGGGLLLQESLSEGKWGHPSSAPCCLFCFWLGEA